MGFATPPSHYHTAVTCHGLTIVPLSPATMERLPPPPPLAAVTLGVVRAAPRLAPLAPLISDFVFIGTSLERAAASGSTRLLERVATRFPLTDPTVREFHFARAMHAALVRDDLAMVQCVHRFHPGPLFMDYDPSSDTGKRGATLELGLRHGALETVQWVMEHRSDRVCSEPGLHRLCRGCVVAALREIGDRDVFRIYTWLLECGVFPTSDKRPLRNFGRPLQRSVELLLDEGRALYLLERAIIELNAPSVVYLLEQGYRLNQRTNIKHDLIRAASAGQETIVDALIQCGECDAFKHQFTWAPVRPGGPRLLQWHQRYLHEDVFYRFTVAELTQTAAFMDINLDVLEWLHTERTGTTFKIHPWHVVPDEAAVLRLYDWMKHAGLVDVLCA